MQLKHKEHVFFLNSMSAQDELNLLNAPDEQDKTITKISGGTVGAFSDRNISQDNLEFIDLEYDQDNENCFYLCLMLLSAPSFYNFVENICKNSAKQPPLINSFHKILSTLKGKKPVPIEDLIPFENCSDIVEGYKFILSSIHEQLLSYFYFTEDEWIVPNREKVIKPIFSVSSPITNMFHGKLIKDVGGVRCGYFDVLRGHSHQSIVSIFKSKELINRPNIVLIETDSLPKETPVGYIVSAIYCKANSPTLYVFSSDKWYRYTREGMSKLDTIKGVNNIRYILLSKSN